MRIGYLHLGPEQHGIRRYSEYIAAEASRRSELTVIEATVTPTSIQQHNQQFLINAAQELSKADVVHFQYSRSVWKGVNLWTQLDYFRTFIRHCSAPLVVTLHDIPSQYEVPKINSSPKFIWHRLKAYLQHAWGRNGFLLWWVIAQCRQTLVCTQEEARRLNTFVGSYWLRWFRHLDIIPHFVEQRTLTLDPALVRAELGLSGVRTITLLGWIFGSKGHRMAIEALAKLPDDVRLIFAGSPTPDGTALIEELWELAEQQGVRDRLHVTGYLSTEDQERYLVATDLAICPFKETSASGSISTWISVARPILASDLPQIREYNQLEPEAIHTFCPYTASDLALAIQHLLPTCTEQADARVAKLRDQLQMSNIFNEHLNCYSQAIDRARHRSLARTADLTASSQ
jgi:glycosyltransferase involved in cell wall biosynthesis